MLLRIGSDDTSASDYTREECKGAEGSYGSYFLDSSLQTTMADANLLHIHALAKWEGNRTDSISSYLDAGSPAHTLTSTLDNSVANEGGDLQYSHAGFNNPAKYFQSYCGDASFEHVSNAETTGGNSLGISAPSDLNFPKANQNEWGCRVRLHAMKCHSADSDHRQKMRPFNKFDAKSLSHGMNPHKSTDHHHSIKDDMVSAGKLREDDSSCDYFSLGAAVRVGRSSLFVVGVDNPDTSDCQLPNWLILGNANAVLADSPDSVIAHTLPLPHHVRDVKYAAGNLVFAALGNGSILALTAEDDGLQLQAEFSRIHGDLIREIAVISSTSSLPLLASGGFDKQVKIFDWDAGRIVQSLPLPDIVGSVRWNNVGQPLELYCTTDSGRFCVFDCRRGGKEPVLAIQTNSKGLFASEQYCEHRILLGYDRGAVRQIDLRQPLQTVDMVFDPYVECVGQIHFHHASNSFVTSGVGGATVWKGGEVSQSAQPRPCIQKNDKDASEGALLVNATWWECDTTIATTSTGSVIFSKHS